jgi:cobalamin biosynthetic protein CobC
MRAHRLSDWTFHGGRLSSARAAYPQARAPWIDLSTGINPDMWPGVAGLEFDWHNLPDEAALQRLEHVAGRYFGAQGADVCALPGTEAGLRGLRHLDLPAPFRHVAPGYRTHGEAFSGSVAIMRDALDAEAAKGGTIVLANPANPDGRLMPVGDLLALAEKLTRAGGWLVVDEAFIDAHPGASIVPHLTGDEPVVVLRSFGKFFGLAGVRLGFAVAPARITAAWRSLLGSWPLSAAAIAIGTAAYADADWITGMQDTLARRADALDAVLRAHALEPQGASPLFRLVDCDALVLFDRLAQAGILTRPFDYDPRWLRFGVPMAAADLARLDAVLSDR